MRRLEALIVARTAFEERPLVITCGATARELASLGLRPTHLPLLDSMGLTTAVGLGVALAHPGPVGVIDGDGSLLMGFSILPTLAAHGAPGLTVLVLDNGQHASAAGIPSQAADLDLAAAARGLGLVVEAVDHAGALQSVLGEAFASADGPRVIVARIEPGDAEDVPFLLEDPAVLGARFAAALEEAHEETTP